MEHRLRGAVDRQEFELHYQPKSRYHDRASSAASKRWFAGAIRTRGW